MKSNDFFDFLAIFILIVVVYNLRNYYVSIGMALVIGMMIMFKYNEITKRKNERTKLQKI